jgi:hypothetical protein
MGKRLSDNFRKRFGNSPRISIKYRTRKKLSLFESEHRNSLITTSYVKMLNGILGREPTQDEILGKVSTRNEMTECDN